MAREHRTAIWAGDRRPSRISAYWDWICVTWPAHYFTVLVRQMAGLEPHSFDRLLNLYSVDLRKPEPALAHARDGFFPPLWWLPDGVFFNPEMLAQSISTRNMVFVLRHLEEKQFNEVVSKHLEPQLLAMATEILLGTPGVTVYPGFNWSVGKTKSEIDLLVYFSQEDVVWHVQAKGGIPPEGARMILTLEGNVRKGLRQLEAFRNLAPAERERFIEKGLGKAVPGIQIVDVVLLRACAGTDRVWQEKKDVCFLTLPLLAELVRQARAEGSVRPLVECQRRVGSYLGELVTEAGCRWEIGEITLLGQTITMPLLKYDHTVIETRRRQCWGKFKFGIGIGTPWKVIPPELPGITIEVVPATTGPKERDQSWYVLRALELMDKNPDWDDKTLGKAAGLHTRFLAKHPLTAGALQFLARYRKWRTKNLRK